MAATTGVLMALFTTDWSRATNFVPAGKSSMTGFSSSAVVATLAPTLAGLLCTFRTNTSDGLRRSSDADCTDELEGAGAVWIPPVSEKSIFPSAYGPTFLGTGVVEDFGCTPITGCVGRAVLPTSSGVTPWLPAASGWPVCAFSRGVTDPVCPVACWPGVSLRPKSAAPARLASVDFLAVLEEENTPRNTRSTAMAAPANCSPRTQLAPRRGGPQPLTPPPATRASRWIACMVDAQTLRHRRRVRKVPTGACSTENPAPVTARPLTIFRAGSAFPTLSFPRVAPVAASTRSRAWSDLRPRTRRPLADLHQLPG